MEIWQILLISFLGIFSFSAFLMGLKHCRKNNPWGLTPLYNVIGAFVWTDASIFGLFWTIVCLCLLIISWFYSPPVDGGNWLLSLTIYSIFWLVRSIGEVIYWINEQFAVNKRNKPETLWHSKIFPGTSAYVASQVFWQCVIVVTLITTLYLIKLWLF